MTTEQQFNKESFCKDVKIYRFIILNISLTEASKQIGISKATLSRIESLNLVDIETFGKCCAWMNKPANSYFKYTKAPITCKNCGGYYGINIHHQCYKCLNPLEF